MNGWSNHEYIRGDWQRRLKMKKKVFVSKTTMIKRVETKVLEYRKEETRHKNEKKKRHVIFTLIIFSYIISIEMSFVYYV